MFDYNLLQRLQGMVKRADHDEDAAASIRHGVGHNLELPTTPEEWLRRMAAEDTHPDLPAGVFSVGSDRAGTQPVPPYRGIGDIMSKAVAANEAAIAGDGGGQSPPVSTTPSWLYPVLAALAGGGALAGGYAMSRPGESEEDKRRKQRRP